MKTILALLPLLAVVACQGAEECKDWSGSAIGAGWSNCGDKHDRRVECETTDRSKMPPTGGAPVKVKCTCTVDGVVGKSFETTDPVKLGTLESATSIANEQCGWHVSR